MSLRRLTVLDHCSTSKRLNGEGGLCEGAHRPAIPSPPLLREPSRSPMSFPHPRRRLAAGSVALLACLAGVLAPPPAVAAGGHYTQILCANPDTGLPVMGNGALPNG